LNGEEEADMSRTMHSRLTMTVFADAGEILATAPKGMEPGGTAVETVHVAAIIEARDAAKRTLTLKGPAGNVIPLKVDKSVTAFDKLQVGESVNVSYAEAFAISVDAP